MISDKTRNILVLIFAVVAAIIILMASTFFIEALYTGIIVVPDAVKGEFWIAAIGIMAVLAPFVQNLLSSKQRNKLQQQQQETHNKVVEVQNEIHDGLKDAVAHKTAQEVIEKLKNGESA